MTLISLPETKNYLRVDHCEDDKLILNQSKKYVETAVSGVAEAMQITMKSDLNMKLDGISGAMMNGGESTTVINNVHNDNSRTVNQTNNSPKSLSRLEIYRMTKNALG